MSFRRCYKWQSSATSHWPNPCFFLELIEELVGHEENHDAEKESVNDDVEGDESWPVVVIAIKNVDVRSGLGGETGTKIWAGLNIQVCKRLHPSVCEKESVSQSDLPVIIKSNRYKSFQRMWCKMTKKTDPKTHAEMINMQTLKVKLTTNILLTFRAYMMIS